MQTNIWAKFSSQFIGQNTRIQLDYRIFWSSISLEGIPIYTARYTTDFLHGDVPQGKEAFEINTLNWVCSGMPSHAQTCLELPKVLNRSNRSISRLKWKLYSHLPKKIFFFFFFLCFNESLWKIIKNVFYFTLKALFALTILKVLFWLFSPRRKLAW